MLKLCGKMTHSVWLILHRHQTDAFTDYVINFMKSRVYKIGKTPLFSPQLRLRIVYLLIITRNNGISRVAGDIYKMISQIIPHFMPNLQALEHKRKNSLEKLKKLGFFCERKCALPKRIWPWKISEKFYPQMTFWALSMIQ